MSSKLGMLLDKRLTKANVNRRDFLKFSSALAATCGVADQFFVPAQAATDIRTGALGPDPIEGSDGVQIKYSVCLQCHSACGMRVKVKDGEILKIDGNPYHPNCVESDVRLPDATDPEDAVSKDDWEGLCKAPGLYGDCLRSLEASRAAETSW
jgi:hypothetical protein